MASCAEVDGVAWCPAASRMAHFSVTMFGSSSTQRIFAIGFVLDDMGWCRGIQSLLPLLRPHHVQLARYCLAPCRECQILPCDYAQWTIVSAAIAAALVAAASKPDSASWYPVAEPSSVLSRGLLAPKAAASEQSDHCCSPVRLREPWALVLLWPPVRPSNRYPSGPACRRSKDLAELSTSHSSSRP